jgi:CRP-like cAMP-binding protein
MQSQRLVHRQGAKIVHAGSCLTDSFERASQCGDEPTVAHFPLPSPSGAKEDDIRSTCGRGEILRGLSTEARNDLESLALQFSFPPATVLINEGQEPAGVLLLLEGKINLTRYSFAGNRIFLGTAGPGEILGLDAVITGGPFEIRAESLCPCKIATFYRQDFMSFLQRYPVACQNVARELSLQLIAAPRPLTTEK